MGLVFKHFWVAFIASTLLNARSVWRRSIQAKIDAKPETEEGYRSLFRGSLFWMNVPWALMGIGIVTGRVGSVHEYLAPYGPNENVVLWWKAMAGVLVWGTFWMFRGGAERLAAHPGLMYVPEAASPTRIKLYGLGACAWNVFFFFVILRPGFPENLLGDTLTPALYPILFVGVWLIGEFALGQMSGWAALAKRYPEREKYAGPIIHTSGKMGSTSYNGILQLGASAFGLHLSMFPLFRLGHPPFAIPWSDVEISREQSFLSDVVQLKLDRTILEMRKRDVQKLARKQTLPYPLEHLGE